MVVDDEEGEEEEEEEDEAYAEEEVAEEEREDDGEKLPEAAEDASQGDAEGHALPKGLPRSSLGVGSWLWRLLSCGTVPAREEREDWRIMGARNMGWRKDSCPSASHCVYVFR